MTQTDKIREMCDKIDRLYKPKYKEPLTEYITIHLTPQIKKQIFDMAIEKDVAVAALCRYLLEQGLEKVKGKKNDKAKYR